MVKTVPFLKFKVVDPHELVLGADDDRVIIFDEYYNALISTPITAVYGGKLDNVFLVGLEEKLIITTAIYSETFEEFLRASFILFQSSSGKGMVLSSLVQRA